MSKLKRPTKLLPLDAPVESADDCELALTELAWMKAETAAVNAEVETECNQIRKRAESRLTAREVKFADRIKMLEKAVIAFAKRAKARLLEGARKNAKTAKLTHGQVTWKEQVERIEISDSEAFDTVTDEVQQALTRSLARQKVERPVSDEGEQVTERQLSVGALLTVKVSLNKASALAAYKGGQISAEELAALGLAWDKPEEKVTLKLSDYSVESASKEAA